MNVSPLPFLGAGLVAGAVAMFFLACSGIVKKRMSARAEELLESGASEAGIRRQLAAEGYDPELSTKVVHRAEIELASDLLERSDSLEEVRVKLRASGLGSQKIQELVAEAALLRWCRRWRVLIVPLGLFLFVVGVIVCGVGLVLGDTPGFRGMLAKELTTFAGAVILSLGLLFVIGAFRKT